MKPSSLLQLPEWHALIEHRNATAGTGAAELFAADPKRFETLSLGLGNLLFDFSKQRVTAHTLDLLVQLAHARGLEEGIRRMASGEHVNLTEDRAALHIALRASRPYSVDGVEVTSQVAATRDRMLDIARQVRDGSLHGATGRPIRRVVNIGIGGSDLGPRMAAAALWRHAAGGPRVDFVANVDPDELDQVLAGANAAETLFIMSSKSFTTIETLTNARRARAWLTQRLGSESAVAAHFFAVTNNLRAAAEFGIPAERCLELPEWVGGRYSMWSAIGLPLACAIGPAGFNALLAGAREMDDHFLAAPLARNLPALMALLGIWNTDFLGAETLAVLPYSHGLGLLPAYLQQLEMESNGKRVTRDGEPVDYPTSPVVWGMSGTVGQHAFHQLFYQGTRLVPIDFVVPVGADDPATRTLLDNAFAQSAALMRGKPLEQVSAELAARGLSHHEIARLAPHMVCPGGQPSSTVMLATLGPHELGMLIALYEHKVFAQGWVWGVNSFDQYGVELGKQMARSLGGTQAPADLDGSTAGLLRAAQAWRKPHGG